MIVVAMENTQTLGNDSRTLQKHETSGVRRGFPHRPTYVTRKFKPTDGFTLLELLMVIAIIAIHSHPTENEKSVGLTF